MEINETPRDLRKKIKRLEESRDLQMAKNREKSNAIKANEGRINELTESRNKWKKKYLKIEENIDHLKKEQAKRECEFNDREQSLIRIVQEKERLLEKENQAKINNENEFQQTIDSLKKKLSHLNS
jgi:chromosome segregation ATPase